MPTDLTDALADVRALLLDAEHLVRGVAAGRRRGLAPPPAERVEVRPVALRSGAHLQLTSRTGPVVSTRNVPVGAAAEAAVDELLAGAWGNLHVDTDTEVVQVRITKKGAAQLHRAAREGLAPAGPQAHDKPRERLVDPDDPIFRVLGAGGDKRRQVEAFVRQLAPTTRGIVARGDEVRTVDLGCGNSYLTFAAHRWLAGQTAAAGGSARTVGVDVRPDVVQRSASAAQEADLPGLGFVTGDIAGTDPFPDEVGAPHVVMALHACDTATDEALARAVRWGAPVVLAAPCCHRDVQRQLLEGIGRSGPLLRHAILRERFADVLTDALRALVLQVLGYSCEVVEFIDSKHTPRNAMLRAVRTASAPREQVAVHLAELDELCRTWQVAPDLARRLAPELAAARSALAERAGDRAGDHAAV